jgi:hypothetical protein
MRSVMVHPLWWPPPQRLAFLIQMSDRVEGEDRRVSAALSPWAPFLLADTAYVLPVCCLQAIRPTGLGINIM